MRERSDIGVLFIQAFLDWELESVASFFELLYDNLPSVWGNDCALQTSLKTNGCLRLICSIMPLWILQFLSSRGRAPRWLRLLERWHTLYGLQTLAKILAFNNLCRRLLMMVGIVCITAAWNLLITCFFNVLSQQIFGSLFSLFK